MCYPGVGRPAWIPNRHAGRLLEPTIRVLVIYLVVGLLAGGIAYLGNQLGRHIGRRKMSVLSLRPRHTSVLITTMTGAMIALVTLSAFAFLSEPVKNLLVGVEQLRREEAGLREKVAQLSRILEEGAIVWKVDEPIVHMTVPAGLPPERTRQALTSLLAEANAKTILRNNGIARDKSDPPLEADQVLLDFDPDQLDRLVGRLSQSAGVMGLRVLADRNCLYRERARVRMEAWEVRRVFREGEEVAHRRINPQDLELLSDFFGFVEATRKEAIRRGMRPIGGDLGGGLTEKQFNALIEQIRAHDGPLDLVAVANRDLYETNSLDVRIEVRPVGSAGGWP